MNTVHPARVRWVREGAAVTGARYVLYWLQINQRQRLNEALDFAIEQADALDLPVVVYQGLRPDYPGANDRLHAFLLEGAADLSRALAAKGIRYLFHLERRPSAAGGLLAALARDAALVVTDDFPVFIVPGQTRALASQIERPLAAIDASCVAPWSIFASAETAARTFRPKLHRALPFHLLPREDIAPRRRSEGLDVPFPFPREGLESEERDWLDLGARTRIAEWVASCAIDHRIGPSPVFRGGASEARERLDEFVATRLPTYPEDRNDPGREGTSGLSPYLHFGQLSALEVALAVLEEAGRASSLVPRRRPPRVRHVEGEPFQRRVVDRMDRSGGLPGGEVLVRQLPSAVDPERLARALTERETPEGAFLEQLLVRRELSFNFCANNPMHASYEGLPNWASDTLDRHSLDPRAELYDREALEWSETKDDVWNTAQSELRLTGVIHNRMRMLWGKKILEWSESPDQAVRTMIDLHDRYALDGRDPNTYTNILWCLGLHDRPFGPERPVTGSIRPMSTAIAEKKLDLGAYRARLARYEGE